MNIDWPRSMEMIAIHRTGSSYTCQPPVLDTDIDFVVLVPELHVALVQLEEDGWKVLGSNSAEGKELYEQDPDYSRTWYSVRRGKFNLMVTNDVDWYIREVAATMLCKELNLMEKDLRIALFRSIRDGTNGYEGPVPGATENEV
jgi:hypothetical protein